MELKAQEIFITKMLFTLMADKSDDFQWTAIVLRKTLIREK